MLTFALKAPRHISFMLLFYKSLMLVFHHTLHMLSLLLTDVRDLAYCGEMQFMDSLSILWFSILANHLWISSSLTYLQIILFSVQICLPR